MIPFSLHFPRAHEHAPLAEPRQTLPERQSQKCSTQASLREIIRKNGNGPEYQ